MLLLYQNITKKRQIDKNTIELDIGKNKKFKIKFIWNCKIYIKKSEIKYLARFYYFIL